MSELNFGDFLSKMGNETSNRKKKPSPPQERYVEESVKPKRQERRIVEEPDYVEESREAEVERFAEERPKSQKSVINEEFMDKAYDYAQGVIKVVRSNFKTTDERVVMLESLRKAIHHYLENVGVTPKTYSPPRTQTESNESPMFGSAPVMSENDWESMPNVSNNQPSNSYVKMNDLSGQEVKPSNQQMKKDYDPSLSIGIRIGSDGKQEADLSGVTAQDFNEMRMLAGMVGPEAERKQKELQEARAAAAAEVREKENQ